MAFYKASVRKESYVDICVEVPESLSKLEAHRLIEGNLSKILRENVSSSDWDDEEIDVYHVSSCDKEEAETFLISKLEVKS